MVERWNPYGKVRVDLFGFIDIVAIGNGTILGVQTTSYENMLARRKKILAIPEAKLWLKAGGLIVVHGWSKKAENGKRGLWKLTEKNIFLQDFT